MSSLKSNPKSHLIPDEAEGATPARRRRAQRMLTLLEPEERELLVDELAHRLSPSYDFFVLSLVAGIVFSIGIFYNSPALLVLGAVVSPMMRPVLGISLGVIQGAGRLFVRNLGGLLIGCLLVFAVSALAGLINSAWPPVTLDQAHIQTRFSWEALAALVIGTILATWMAEREIYQAALPSVAISYGLYLPLSAAGFGLGGRIPHLWPDGLVVFVAHLALASLAGALTFAFLGYRPMTLFGYSLGGAALLLGIMMIVGLSATGAAYVGRIALPTYTPTLTPTLTPTVTPSLTPLPPTLTPTASQTPTLTPTITLTPTPTSTPVLANINFADGAKLRAKPGYSSELIELLAKGTVIQILEQEPVEIDGQIWLPARTPSGKEGWIWRDLLSLPQVNATALPSSTTP